MKHGLLYYKDTDNIGDDIQSYAASLFMPKIDYMIDRENIELFVPKKREYVVTIMNAWYVHDEFNFNFSPFIYPKLISMHFKNFPYTAGYTVGSDYINDEMKSFLKKYGPIGARDKNTETMMKKLNIDCYFSGCLTLTLSKFEGIVKENYICAVGLSDEEIKKIKSSTGREVKVIVQDIQKGSLSQNTWEERKNKVIDLLMLYQKAHMVVTTKLHCALPCLALGTPVLLLYDDRYADRISTYLPYLNYIQRKSFIENSIDFEKPKRNSKKYLKLRDSLTESCTDFINNLPQNLAITDLPDPDYYLNTTMQNRKRRETIMNFLNEVSLKYEAECSKSSGFYDNCESLTKKLNIANEKIERLRSIVTKYETSIFYRIRKRIHFFIDKLGSKKL